MEQILNTYYPLSDEDVAGLHLQKTVNADNILNFRLGGVFHNSNQCARYITFLLAGFIITNSEKSMLKLMPFILMSLYAVILTGSRTGFVVTSLIIIAYLFVDKRIALIWRLLAVTMAITVFIVLTMSGSDTFRGFNVSEGFEGSARMKMDTFAYYLASEKSVLYLLLGHLDVTFFDSSSASFHVMENFDSDYGSIIFSYGFVGFLSILYYLYTIFKRMDKYGRLFFIILLWIYGSTIISSFRALFLFMFLLACVYGNHKKQTNNHNIQLFVENK